MLITYIQYRSPLPTFPVTPPDSALQNRVDSFVVFTLTLYNIALLPFYIVNIKPRVFLKHVQLLPTRLLQACMLYALDDQHSAHLSES